jgi:hypothetical protein
LIDNQLKNKVQERKIKNKVKIDKSKKNQRQKIVSFEDFDDLIFEENIEDQPDTTKYELFKLDEEDQFNQDQ